MSIQGFIICPEAGNYLNCDVCSCSHVHTEDDCLQFDNQTCPRCEPIDQDVHDEIEEAYQEIQKNFWGASSPLTAPIWQEVQRLECLRHEEFIKKYMQDLDITRSAILKTPEEMEHEKEKAKKAAGKNPDTSSHGVAPGQE